MVYLTDDRKQPFRAKKLAPQSEARPPLCQNPSYEAVWNDLMQQEKCADERSHYYIRACKTKCTSACSWHIICPCIHLQSAGQAVLEIQIFNRHNFHSQSAMIFQEFNHSDIKIFTYAILAAINELHDLHMKADLLTLRISQNFATLQTKGKVPSRFVTSWSFLPSITGHF